MLFAQTWSLFNIKAFLDLSYNHLIGQIPTAITKCSMLMLVNLQGNLPNGSIPWELGQLTNLTTIEMSFNGLVGPMLPRSASLIQLQGLLMLSKNHLDGTIPTGI
jgi:hypothetical protein